MDIEKDIKILEKFNPGDEYTGKIKVAIENILSEREQNKKRIKELEEENRIFKDSNVLVNRYFKLKDNSIPVQKVKDEIEKHKIAKEGLEKEYDNKHYEDNEIRARDFYGIVTQDRIIQVLENLLEDK